MTSPEKDATLFWLHLKEIEGGVLIDGVKVPVEEVMELVNNVTPVQVGDTQNGLDAQ